MCRSGRPSSSNLPRLHLSASTFAARPLCRAMSRNHSDILGSFGRATIMTTIHVYALVAVFVVLFGGIMLARYMVRRS
jgi:hypothetical protein